MKLIKSILLVVVLTAFTSSPAEVKLQYTFKVGDQFDWLQTTASKITQNIMGNEQITETSVDAVLKLKTIALTATGAKFEAEYASLQSSTKSPQGEMIIDSKGDTSNMMNKLMNSMVGKKFSFSISRNGTIESIENMENIWSGLSTLKIPAEQVAPIKGQMEQAFGGKGFKAALGITLLSYPDKKIKIGDSWTNNTSSASMFPMQVVNTWTLKSITDGVAEISGSSVMSTTDAEKTTTLPGGFKAKSDLAGTQTIICTIAVGSGWPSEVKISGATKGKLILLAGGPIPEDMDLPMEVLTETRYKLIKK